ncbi:MAG: amidohydrolase family protein, partial [Lachnospiraceae bacterium]|nr:amidohydrolase family protein [Lachnospiraceae bacterium]
MTLLQRTAYDEQFYREELFDFLPETFIDCHTHIWKDEFLLRPRVPKWESFVSVDNPIEDLIATNEELFPGKKCISVLYPNPISTMDVPRNNEYTLNAARKYHFPALYLSRPEEPAEHLREEVLKGGYAGVKVYLNYAPSYIPEEEIRIYDFLPKEHLKVIDELGKVVQVHIARSKRLADPVNYVQLGEIEENYPNLTLIVAHLGRAYADADVGNALEYLKDTKKTMWDFTANTNQHVMEQVLEKFGPKRFIYGSDFPVFRMKARRTVENDYYINEVPKGSLGNLDGVA